MDLRLALITEGASEYRILKHILQCYCSEEPEINQIQPQIVGNKQMSVGGWREVLRFCENRESDLLEILKYNDYIIIQIDTDMCQISPYDVPKLDSFGKPLSEEALWLSVQQRILNALPVSIPKEKIILAICIDMIECWLLPVYATNAKYACRTNNCLVHLNNDLRRNNIHIITDKNSTEAHRIYDTILKSLRKRKDIDHYSSFHFGFHQFVDALKTF